MARRVPDVKRISAIAERLRLTRAALDYESQAEFALKAGIQPNTYNQYEQAKGRPSLDNALNLCATYGLTLDWIFRGDPGGLPLRIASVIQARAS